MLVTCVNRTDININILQPSSLCSKMLCSNEPTGRPSPGQHCGAGTAGPGAELLAALRRGSGWELRAA